MKKVMQINLKTWMDKFLEKHNCETDLKSKMSK